MTPADDIASFSEFSAHLRDHLDHRKTTNRPLFVTTDGQPEAVVLSPAAYDAMRDQADLANSLVTLDRSMEDIRAGRTQPAEQAIRNIAADLNLSLDR